MYTFKIAEVEKNLYKFNFTVDIFKDGAKITEHKFENVSDVDSVKQLIRNQVNQIKKIDELDLPLGDIDISLPEPLPPVEPTAEEIKLKEYTKKKGELTVLKLDLDLGLATQGEYQSKLNEIKSLK